MEGVANERWVESVDQSRSCTGVNVASSTGFGSRKERRRGVPSDPDSDSVSFQRPISRHQQSNLCSPIDILFYCSTATNAVQLLDLCQEPRFV